jgi:uncharacterized repeat protein (TIGR03847 family)
MAGDLIDFNPVSRITIDAVGAPGQRLFVLQASQGTSTITLKLEKDQASILVSSILELLDSLNDKYPRAYTKFDEPLKADLVLKEPFEPSFAIGQIGLGYDESQDLVVLVVQEVQVEDDPRQPLAARFWTTRPQAKALCDHTLEVIKHGRPLCPLCNLPLDPDGHFCPKSNGHEKKWV